MIRYWWKLCVALDHLFHPSHRKLRHCGHDLCCGRERTHWTCAARGCIKVTCRKVFVVEPGTLRRRMKPSCSEHEAMFYRTSDRTKRTRRDWDQMSTPVATDAIIPDLMGEQYEGEARRAVRAFFASGARVATVESVGSVSLQQTVDVLGLGDEVYAEQRGKTTVLRRIGDDDA